MSPQAGSVDRAIGAAASLGMSLAILRLVFSAFKAVKGVEGAAPNADTSDLKPTERTKGYGGAVSDAFYGYIRRLLRKILLDETHDSGTLGNTLEDPFTANDGVIITHQGSCHCESVRFEIIAPRCLAAQDGPGKIQYLHTHVKSSNFRVIVGQDCLKTYYVASRRSPSRGAHAFCERCGVHVLYAPCKDSSNLQINVNCIEEGIRKVRVVDTKNTISDGVPVEGQWDGDQLSTISEVTQDSRLVVPLHHAESSLSNGISDWKAYQNYEQIEELPTQDSFAAQKSRFPVTPATASTVDSFSAAADSQLASSLMESASLPVGGMDSDVTSVYSRMAQSVAGSSPRKHVDYQQPTAIPELRDQMKYFMKKHLSSPTSAAGSPHKEEKTLTV
jgi:hypothetical protein